METCWTGERGFYWRNELQAPLGGSGQVLYAVIGLRGGLGSRMGSVSSDLFVGTPIYKPTAFHTAGVTAGLQVVYQY